MLQVAPAEETNSSKTMCPFTPCLAYCDQPRSDTQFDTEANATTG